MKTLILTLSLLVPAISFAQSVESFGGIILQEGTNLSVYTVCENVDCSVVNVILADGQKTEKLLTIDSASLEKNELEQEINRSYKGKRAVYLNYYNYCFDEMSPAALFFPPVAAIFLIMAAVDTALMPITYPVITADRLILKKKAKKMIESVKLMTDPNSIGQFYTLSEKLFSDFVTTIKNKGNYFDSSKFHNKIVNLQP